MALAVFAALALLARTAIADRGNVAMEVGGGTRVSVVRSHQGQDISEIKDSIRELQERVDRLEATQEGETAEEFQADLGADLAADLASCPAFEAGSRHCCLRDGKCECTHTFVMRKRFEFNTKTNLGYKEEKKSSYSNVGYKDVWYTDACSDAKGNCSCVTPQYAKSSFVAKMATTKSPCKRGQTQCSEWRAPLY
jgi:hypothetical protein